MSKSNNKRKNSLEVLEGIVVENTNNVEVVNMNELNKGLVVEQIEDLKGQVLEMHDNMEVCLESGLVEDAHELHTEIVLVEDMLVDMENRVGMFVEDEQNEMLDRVKHGMRYAIAQGKNAEYSEKFVDYKQIQAIIKQYKNVTDVEMDDEQVKYIKTLNPIQIRNILITLNKANKLALS